MSYDAISDTDKPQFASQLLDVMQDNVEQQIEFACKQIFDISACEKTVACAHDTFIDCWNALLSLIKG